MVHTESEMDLPRTIGCPRVFHFSAGTPREVKMATLQMDAEGAKFGVLMVSPSGIDMVPGTVVGMVGTPMVGLAINHKESLFRVEQYIKGDGW